MLIFDDNSKPIILDSIYTPMVTEHFWVLDLELRDYMLAPLVVLEEIQCPSIALQIFGFSFIVPANWGVLVYDEETTQLDIIESRNLAGKEFTALVYGAKMNLPQPGVISVVDYNPNFHNVAPSLHKHQLLCHPISPTAWVNIAPSDSYNKYLKDIIVADLVSD